MLAGQVPGDGPGVHAGGVERVAVRIEAEGAAADAVAAKVPGDLRGLRHVPDPEAAIVAGIARKRPRLPGCSGNRGCG